LPEDIYEAISHPTRRAIVKALGERGRMTFTELMERRQRQGQVLKEVRP